ncbi:pseudaminic acid synthase [Sphingobacterium faecium]|uniref:pseudaminic acid synthase n=1 Tax=Sphingobacterium faecium TaxID=34087 RepID=UPI0024697BA4|nr:pseudaminic acid synthase [Sphingobacterium faecium]MDH5828678.1 pseudaminic acid synthase [Sphingobacterium faecium]
MKEEKEIFIIAEISANHNNDLNLALRTIEAIATTGADAVKVQTYTADSLTLDVDSDLFMARKGSLWEGRRLYDLYQEASLPYEWHAELKAHTEKFGMEFFSSPFDFEAVDLLESMDVPRYKIASFEITDIPLIAYTASKGKPIIISTGVASLADIELAVQTCRNVGNDDITLLKCTSEYPASADIANLLTIPNLRDTFGVKVGVSDHTMGSTVPVVAVTLGARVVEKHFILDRSLGGPDAAFSMEPQEFKEMVDAVRDAYLSLGSIGYSLSEKNMLRRRSLFISQDIKAGDTITKDNIKSVRPGHGLHPKYYEDVLGLTARKDLSKGTPLSLEDLN